MNGYRAAGYARMPVAFVVGHHPGFELAAGGTGEVLKLFEGGGELFLGVVL